MPMGRKNLTKMTKKIRKLKKRQTRSRTTKRLANRRKTKLQSMTAVRKSTMMLLSPTEARRTTTTQTTATTPMRLWPWISIQRAKPDVFKDLFLIRRV